MLKYPELLLHRQFNSLTAVFPNKVKDPIRNYFCQYNFGSLIIFQ